MIIIRNALLVIVTVASGIVIREAVAHYAAVAPWGTTIMIHWFAGKT